MYRNIILIFLFSLLSFISFGQVVNQDDIDKIIDKLSAIENQDYSYRFDYIENQTTLELTVMKGDRIAELYSLLVNDIHPEGIFVLEMDDGIVMKILSKNNSKVFTYERFINGHRFSSNIRFIELGILPLMYKKILNDITNLIKEMISIESEAGPNIVNPPRTRK